MISSSQLPADMQHCTILFKECPQGHGRLTATNWIDSGCLMCKLDLAKTRDILNEWVRDLTRGKD